MLFAFGVGSTDKIFSALFVDFQVVGDGFAARTIAKNQSI
jgi:hypothetical protein